MDKYMETAQLTILCNTYISIVSCYISVKLFKFKSSPKDSFSLSFCCQTKFSVLIAKTYSMTFFVLFYFLSACFCVYVVWDCMAIFITEQQIYEQPPSFTIGLLCDSFHKMYLDYTFMESFLKKIAMVVNSHEQFGKNFNYKFEPLLSSKLMHSI